QTMEQSIPTKIVRNLTFKQMFPHQKRMRQMTNLVGIYQRTGIQKIIRKTKALKILPEHMDMMKKTLPTISANKKLKQRPHHLQAIKKQTHKVAFFSGCLMDTVFMTTNDATTKLLQLAGCEIVIPETQGCCGALHGHSGELQQAKKLAK